MVLTQASGSLRVLSFKKFAMDNFVMSYLMLSFLDKRLVIAILLSPFLSTAGY